MNDYEGAQQAICRACGVMLDGFSPHLESCPYNSTNSISALSVWEAMQHRLEALHANFFTGQTTNAAPVEPKSLTLADLERAVHDIDPDGRMLQEGRLMAACHKLNKEQVETVIRFAEAVLNA